MTGRQGDRFAWIREALRQRGYTQRDLARAWGVAEASVSRFVQGNEQPDPAFSRAVALAGMLGISLEELARGLGIGGKQIEPSVRPPEGALPPVGTCDLKLLEPGRVRIIMVQDVSPAIAGQIVSVIGGSAPH